MSDEAPAPVDELAEALRRIRIVLASHLREPEEKPDFGMRPTLQPWLCWIAAAFALLLAWLWPLVVGNEGTGAARVTGAYTALAALTAGTFYWFRQAPSRPILARPAADKATPPLETDPLAAFSNESAVTLVRERFDMSDFEMRVLLLCAAAEIDSAVPVMLQRLQEGGLRQPVFALAQKLFPEGAWDVLSDNRPLLHWLMVEARQQDGRPLAYSPLRIDDGMLQFLIGNPAADTRLAAYQIPFPPEATARGLSLSQAEATVTLGNQLQEGSVAAKIVPVAVLTGPHLLAQQMTAMTLVEAMGGSASKLVRVPVALLPTDPRDAEHLSRLWAREAILQGLSLFLETEDAPESAIKQVLRSFFVSPRTLYFVSSREPVSGLTRSHHTIAIARPTADEQQAVWEQGAAAAGLRLEQGDASCLADQFNLDVPVIISVIDRAQDQKFDNSPALRRHLQLTARQDHRAALDLLAQRIEPRATMDDLVLPEREKDQLRKFQAHVELHRLVFSAWGMGGRSERGKGSAALFSGESGTGKTLAAEVIAAELGLDLYRIDLSAVVDKYIGETEKNLRRIFDAAESGGVILFFDEADALFGKRSEVKDSHDRYANIQINYLLQRLETYRGPTVLATNLGRTMDQAFMRRLRFIVRFPQPGRPERQKIWEKCFAPLNGKTLTPDGKPVIALSPADYHAIAGPALSGGEIRNAAIHAAFLAAASQPQVPVTRQIVEEAIRDESQKAGRPIPAAHA